MSLSLSLAKQLLSHLTPPIKDQEIKESLWHYFFDVDKTVAYLEKQRSKGEFGVTFLSSFLFSEWVRMCSRLLFRFGLASFWILRLEFRRLEFWFTSSGRCGPGSVRFSCGVRLLEKSVSPLWIFYTRSKPKKVGRLSSLSLLHPVYLCLCKSRDLNIPQLRNPS